LYKSNIKLPTSNISISSRILDSFKYSLYFNNYLGTLDRIYIEIYILVKLQSCYCNRKRILLQNVLAVCNFDIQFVYILAGWEGSAYNTRVLTDTQAFYSFATPSRKYWLGNRGYRNSKFVIVLYRSIQYYLKEARQIDLRPENAKELFNLQYSSLRNVIEYIFGVLKRQ
jgi:hypothetical protein